MENCFRDYRNGNRNRLQMGVSFLDPALGDRQLTSQKELRAPQGSFTVAWRACALEAATLSTACDTRHETRTKESSR